MDKSRSDVRVQPAERGAQAFLSNSLAVCHPELVLEWDAERNAPLTPAQVTVGSHRRIWWKCGKGHSWQTVVKSRTLGTGCPYCTGKKVLPGFNDLATGFPVLAEEWDTARNAPLTPQQVTPGTRRKVWWHCEKGHSWCAAVNSRTTSGSGCPYCAGKEVLPGYNDLRDFSPLLARQWDRAKNGGLTPEQVTPYSNLRVWWRCDKGHSYQAAIAARANGSGCPYCTGRKVLRGFNDLETKYPSIAAQWHPTLNGALRPDMVVAGSHKKVWWLCSEGHSWRAVVYSRTGPQKCGCPVCAGRVSMKWQRRYAELSEGVRG